MEITMIKTDLIKPSKDNRRAEADIGYLSSVGEVGIINPIQVVKAGKNGYRVVAGSRRLASAVHFGLEEVPCVVMGSKGAVAVQAAENFDRKPLNPLDEADMIVRLRNDGVADPVIQDWLHISRRDLNRRLLLLDLCDEAKEGLRDGKLCIGSALELATIRDAADQSMAYQRFDNNSRQNPRGARVMVRYSAQYLGNLPQDFLDYVASDGRICAKCQYASGCSDDYSLFAEGDEMRCHDMACFRVRLNEYREMRKLTATPPPNCVRVWNYRGHEDDYTLVIDDDGDAEYYEEKAEVGKACSSDKTLPCRKAHNKAMKTLNPILTEIARLTVEKLKERYISLYRDDIPDMCLEQGLIDRMASRVCSDLYHEGAVAMGKLLGHEGDFSERLSHVWNGLYVTGRYRPEPKKEVTPDDVADAFAWSALIVRLGKYNWDGVYLPKAVAGGGYPAVIDRDNPLILLARDVVPEWDGGDLCARWCKAWEDYVSEQKSLGNSNVK